MKAIFAWLFIVTLSVVVGLFLIPATVSAVEDCFYGVCDTDNDGLTNGQEREIYYTDPLNPDSDGDGYDDGVEIEHNYSPLHGDNKKLIEVDSDDDELNDYWELALGTDLMNPDTDNDSYTDGVEFATSHDPLDTDIAIKERLVKVNIAGQYLEYYFGEQLMDSFPISGGLASMPTPQGQFTVLDKVPIKHYGGAGFNYPDTKWNMHFATRQYRYYIHGAYWHDNFGQPMSHGCVNVSYKDMEPLYNWSQIGTKIIVE